MRIKYTEMRLEECMDTIVDYRGKTPKKSNSGIPLITAKIVKNGQLQDVTEFIAKGDYNSWMTRGLPLPGDIVLTTEAPLGEVAQLDERKVALAQRIITLRGKKGLLSNDYLLYLLQSSFVQNQLNGRASGSTVTGIKQSELREIILKFPSIQIQKYVSAQLKSIEQKIFINKEINKTLEQISQTLFKSWFVDFDPVIDNALEAGNPIPDSLHKRANLRQKVRNSPDFKPLSEEIRTLFPAEFEETELGWVPKGWNIYTLFEASSFLKRGISPKYIEDGGVQVINQKCIRNHEINFSLCRRNNTELKKVSGYELELGDILINSTGVGTLGRMAQVRFLPENSVVDSHVTVVRANETLCPKYTFGQLLMLQENVIEQLGEGSTGQTELNRKVLSDQKILLPNPPLSKYVEKYILNISEKIAFNSIQIQSLTQLRDTLLPKLISGELSLDDLPETVTETKCA
ncbi:restriction endonuclease subunit S [Xenorhabdus taiwanensis]|uniref:Type I restriction modification DNA specificity domain-containing protein n=1 Tax=Xenorhabdus taiwanensis TaxID=3085177 RepID=A0ABN7CAJ9_9GAMM|nr:hypothetical protein TCT1_32310 [Xenorhabdus sp. TCT-1]